MLDHCVPFQCRINVSPVPPQPEGAETGPEPKAQMSLAEDAERLVRLAGTSAGTGVGTTLHCVPFQCSMSGPPPPPTAQTLLAARAATAKREPVPAGLGKSFQA